VDDSLPSEGAPTARAASRWRGFDSVQQGVQSGRSHVGRLIALDVHFKRAGMLLIITVNQFSTLSYFCHW
jgi:hypothetical protein